MIVENYQNLMIGSGVGGKLLAWTLAKRGQKTVAVERSMIGGSCPNVACLPSKNVIYSAKLYRSSIQELVWVLRRGRLESIWPASFVANAGWSRDSSRCILPISKPAAPSS